MKSLFLILLFALFSKSLFGQWIVQLDSISAPHDNNSIYFTSESTGYVTGWDRLYKTINGGTNWTNENICPGEILTSVFFVDSNTGFVTSTNGKWLKTTDGGNTFSIFTNVGYGGSLNSMFFLDQNTGWCVGGNGSGTNFISKTVDGGSNWNVQKVFGDQEGSSSVLFINSDTGLTSCGNQIWITSNGGANWNSVSSFNNYLTHFSFIGNSLYAVGLNGSILKSFDHGFSWSLLTSPTNKILWQSYFIDESTGYIAGDSGLILYTSNGGSSFITQTTGTSKNLKSIFFFNEKGWCAGNIDEISSSGILLQLNEIINLNMKVLIEGFYFPLFNQMSRKDSVRTYLCNSVSPYNKFDSSIAVVDSLSFTGSFEFQDTPSGTYYLVLKHFNSLETWSKSGGEMLTNNGSVYNYDFTTGVSQAYGNNLKRKGTKYCIYSGDINFDGVIDGSDALRVHTDSFNFVTGYYISTDLNGDNFVDGTDYSIVDNNAFNFVVAVSP